MNEIINEQYDNNQTTNIIMASFSLGFYIIIWIFTLCLQCTKRVSNEGIMTSSMAPVVPVQPPYPPVYSVLYGSKNNFNNIIPPGPSYGIPYS